MEPRFVKKRFVQSKTRLYRIWSNMKTRCYSPKCKEYILYGGKGVTICDAWLNDFQAFEDWAYSNGYREHLTIDRIDNNGIYEPSNCRWATQYVQCQNRGGTLLIEIDGEIKSLSEWAVSTGLPYSTIKSRYYKHCDRGKALIRPLRQRKA